MDTKLKPGDRVRYKNGNSFTGGMMEATIEAKPAPTMFPRHVWLKEPGTHTHPDCLYRPSDLEKEADIAAEEARMSPEALDGPSDGEAVVSDGGSTSYYFLPEEATELNDLIEAKEMSFARANIFKACYRLGEKNGTSAEYDINKIILFAERMKGMIAKGIPL